MLYLNIEKELPYFKLNINLLFENEVTVIIGRSGAGKTSLLNCIAGFMYPDKGLITLNERTLFKSTKKYLRPQYRKLGYLFQDYALFPHMTVKQNIYYGLNKKGRKDDINELIQQLNLFHLLNQYPYTISGGEQQRVAIARALAIKPQLLLLDEPFSALDDETRYECQQMLLTIRRNWNIPFIIVIHHQQEANRLGNRILYIENGQVVEDYKVKGKVEEY